MTFSMTGYGKQTAAYNGRLLTLEIRTLNSKQADLNLRIPSVYREKEFEVRDLLSSQLNRGKIDFFVQRDLAPDESTTTLNEELFQRHYKQLKSIEEKLGVGGSQNSGTDYLSLIMKMPDALKSATEELDTEEYNIFLNAVNECIAKCMAFREQEGAKLETVLSNGVQSILEKLEAIQPLESERIDRIRGRIQTNLNGESTDNSNVDRDRFEQELIYYLEKIDITEEKVRLKAHCDFFLKTLKEEQFKGKKLSFISQEMGREINTLGSKAQHSDIQKIVVGMKDELEKIKEQVLNIL